MVRKYQSARGRSWQTGDWEYVTVLFALFAALLCIAYGRSAFGIDYSKSSRYAEIAMLLVPITVLGVARATYGTQRTVLLGVVWLVAAAGYSNDWDFVSPYRQFFTDRKAETDCLQKLASNADSSPCLTNTWGEPQTLLQRAIGLRVSFTRRWSDDTFVAEHLPQIRLPGVTASDGLATLPDRQRTSASGPD
ncbi:hypothetical protein [Planctomicrobium sp. SH664]|uniref:hypothetical protein n=1 Tax=Planctomicrobium sp. SH664 TaxID=3448125 RepID=UPI003F5C5997